ncbi:hypothetical protein THMIRHAS_23000 [Thiosulfatimonas sediminis]|uniref:DUF5678 domain-containing protein n=1 Tax=Thiosulfatimonas sediminis TaxID=2675054 RepID=A0A6F8PY06_9GAMM|nr:hypothetical protein [Thiosulfatimonas sediminis]BBP46927.1 hypothetical protein THMIRHAS_23000 [Thiosulfatimonas sediminis]
MKRYAIEFNGYDYVILDQGSVVAAFATLDDAYQTMRDFEEKLPYAAESKIPPAMRWAKQNLYVMHG